MPAGSWNLGKLRKSVDLVKFIDDSVESPINKEMLSGMINDSVLGNSDAYIKNILTGFGAPDSIINNFNNKK